MNISDHAANSVAVVIAFIVAVVVFGNAQIIEYPRAHGNHESHDAYITVQDRTINERDGAEIPGVLERKTRTVGTVSKETREEIYDRRYTGPGAVVFCTIGTRAGETDGLRRKQNRK